MSEQNRKEKLKKLLELGMPLAEATIIANQEIGQPISDIRIVDGAGNEKPYKGTIPADIKKST